MWEKVKPFWPVPLRLVLGFGLAYHGVAKISSLTGNAIFAEVLRQLGVPLPGVMSWVVGGVEVIGALLIVAGSFVAVAAALNAVVQVVALLLVHLPHGFNFANVADVTAQGAQFATPGFEVNLLYLAGLAALIIGGHGPVSLVGHLRRLARR